MEDQGQFLSRILSASAILTAVVVGGFVILDRPFQSARSPSGSATALFESRLWEDPLKSIYEIETRQEELALGNGQMPRFDSYLDVLTTKREFKSTISDTLGENAIAMGVIMPSGRFSLTSEIRRRIRYAVVSALNQSHLPLDSEGLSVLALSHDNLGANSVRNNSFDQVLMSYEVYEPDESSAHQPTRGRVVVFWIPSRELGSDAINGFASILSTLGMKDARAIKPVLIGPDNSSGLLNLFRELHELRAVSNASGRAETSISLLSEGDQSGEISSEELFNRAINDVANEAHSYLDNGLSQSQYSSLVDCDQWQDEGYFLGQEAITSCLEGLDINDTDQNWRRTVAGWFPADQWHSELESTLTSLREDASEAAQTTANANDGADSGSSTVSLSDFVKSQIIKLGEESDWYLDNGLPLEQYGQLVACIALNQKVMSLTQELVSRCLQSLGIDDSDSSWFDTMSYDFPGEELVASLGDTENPFTVGGHIWQILLEANRYLDDGLPPGTVVDLVECLQEDVGETEISVFVAECLQSVPVSDSDRTWYETVASSWYRSTSVGIQQSLQQEDTQTTLTSVDRIAREILILSPRATISDSALRRRLGNDSSLQNFEFDSLSSRIIRTTNTDDRLLLGIYDELLSRGIEKTDSVALIFESDSDYGRALRRDLDCTVRDAGNDKRCFDNVRSYSYLRGIDGQLPGEGSGSTSQNERGESGGGISTFNLDNLQADLEAPAGRQQLDYLRRIAREIAVNDFDVIGVLGTDIFDKLLVLQALSDLNPGAIFFTTDLYSFLAHESQLEWSRNLLVASSFPLDGLNDSGNVCPDRIPRGRHLPESSDTYFAAPPFRDNYQSAYFYSACYALRNGLIRNLDDRKGMNDFFKNKRYLYEIGDSGPVELQVVDSAGFNFPERSDFTENRVSIQILVLGLLLSPLIVVRLLASRELSKVKNKPDDSFKFYYGIYCVSLWLLWSSLLSCFFIEFLKLEFSLINVFFLVVIGGLSLCGLLAAYARFKELLASKPKDKSLRVFWLDKTNSLLCCKLVCLFTLILIAGLLLTELLLIGGEPLSLLDGISSWPAVIVRIEVLALSLCFCFYGYAKWDESNRESEYALLGDSPETRRKRFLDQTLGAYMAHARERIFKPWDQVQDWGEAQQRQDPASLNSKNYWRISSWVNQIDADTVVRESRLHDFDEGDRTTQPVKKKVSDIWREYRILGNWRCRLARSLLLTGVLTSIVFGTFLFLTPSPALHRDSFWLADVLFSNGFTLLTAFIAILMIVLGNDVTRLGAAFIRALRQYDLSDETFKPEILGLSSYDNPSVDRKVYILEAIARRTKAITPLILFPFMVVFLMIIARSSLFEGWRWGVELILVYTGISAYILYGAYLLQREATLSRNKVIRYLGSPEVKMSYWQDGSRPRHEQELILGAAFKHVNELNEGAFVVWYKHPIFQSIAVPTSGTSGLFLLQYLT